MAHSLFKNANAKKVLIGVVHLPPLPGSPGWGGDMGWVLDRAQEEASVLEQGGANGIIVENFGDVPFRIGPVEPDTVAAMTLAVARVKQGIDLPVGVNMLRNDAKSALAVAATTGADFIRVNVHYGVMAAEEGLGCRRGVRSFLPRSRANETPLRRGRGTTYLTAIVR